MDIWSLALAVATLLPAAAHGQSIQRFVGFTDVPEMPTPRSDMTVTSYNTMEADNTRLYIIGGCSADQVCGANGCSCGEVTNSTQYFLPGQNRYVTTNADMPRPRYRHAAAELNGVIYVFGGRSLNDSLITDVDAYDIAGNVWSTPCSWTSATSDNTAFVADNRIFLTGGYNADYSTAVSDLLEFTPNGCSFTPRASMPAARGDVSSTTVGGLSFVIGGFESVTWSTVRTVQAYNATSDAWTTHPDMLLGRADAAVGDIDGQLFVLAGETYGPAVNRAVPVADVERLQPGTSGTYQDSWVIARAIPSNRFRFVGATYQSAIYLFGGQGAYVNNLQGADGGFPVHKSVMKYAPYTYTAAEVTMLLDTHNGNVTSLDDRIGGLATLSATQATTIAELRVQLANVTATLLTINAECFTSSGARARRSEGCRREAEPQAISSSTSGNTALYVGVTIGVVVALAAAIIAIAVWKMNKSGRVTMAPPAPVMNSVFDNVLHDTQV